MNVKAMIFAAGLGTRLYPLTADKPKALIEINGVSLLETVIRKLIRSGIRDMVVNVHHFSNQIIDFIHNRNFDANILISDESAGLLDTAGGLKFAAPHLTGCDHILLYNVDIISSLDLTSLIDSHIKQNALATLAVKQRETLRYFIFDKNSMQLCGWKNYKTGEEIRVENRTPQKSTELAFSGIHVVKQEILDMIPASQKMSFTPLYLKLAGEYRILGYAHPADSWMDMGKYEDYLKMNGIV